jgi:predicted DNA-binding transcriptional regulator YafY
MSLQHHLTRLEQADSLISRKATGNAACFAKKLNFSRSKLYKFLDELKELGIPIAYSREQETYYYSEPGKLRLDLFVKDLDEIELKKIKGGKNYQIFHLSPYSRQTKNNFTK